MPAPSSEPTATLLDDGRVLVLDGSSSESAASVYDRRSDSWASAGSVAAGPEHTATLLRNGKVLVVGAAGAMLYEPATNSWSAAGAMATPRSGHTATLLADGEVLVTGGGSLLLGELDSSEIYDPRSNTWHTAASLPWKVSDHTATRLANGEVLVAGGLRAVTPFLVAPQRAAELYDPASDSWTATGSLATQRFNHRAVLLRSGRVLVVSGCPFEGVSCVQPIAPELYDPATGTWSPAGTPIQPIRSHPSATLLRDGEVLVAGGFSPSSCGSSESDASAEVYGPIANDWRETSSLSTGRGNHAAVRLVTGRVLVVGGVHLTATPEGLTCASESTSLASAEIYAIG